MRICLLLAILAVGAFAKKKEEKDTAPKSEDLSRGFNPSLNWVKFDQAFEVAKKENKPIFLLIHKTWCGACKGLQREFNKDTIDRKKFEELAQNFVLTNTEDDEEPEDEIYAPDGGYIPRILFFEPDGERIPVSNKKNYRNNHYYYPLVEQVNEGMKKALKHWELRDEADIKEQQKKKTEKAEKKEEEKTETKEKEEEAPKKEEEVKEEEEEKVEKKVEKTEKKEKKEKKAKKEENKADSKEEEKPKETEKKDKKKDEKKKKEKKAKDSTEEGKEEEDKKDKKKKDKKDEDSDSKEEKKKSKKEKKEKKDKDDDSKETKKKDKKDKKKKEKRTKEEL